MTKRIMKVSEVRNTYMKIASFWNNEAEKATITLKGKQLYKLIAIKKKLEEKTADIEETLMALCLQYGGKKQESGSILIEDEAQREAANKALDEFGAEEVTIEFNPIELFEEDDLSIDLMEILFHFIEFKE